MSFSGTVLLVDDEAHIRKFLGVLVRRLGAVTLLEAGDGEDAVAAFKRGKPSLVLLDINMPGMDGLETLRQLKAIDPACVVVMITSVANRQTVEQALAAGAAGYIRKDVPSEEILQSLTEAVASVPKPEDPRHDPS